MRFKQNIVYTRYVAQLSGADGWEWITAEDMDRLRRWKIPHTVTHHSAGTLIVNLIRDGGPEMVPLDPSR